MASSNELCIFTPTYNRAYCLSDLFESLCRQTTMRFEWLIVDDGSTDNTQELVNSFQTKGKFPITYIKQDNGGKQRAFNTGVQRCKSELFMCVDSDDTVPADMVITIGYMKLKRMYVEYADTWWLRFYETILYMVGCHFAHQNNAIKNAPYRFLAIMAWLPAQILCHTVYRPN